jgi:polyisoprenyl-phosphate glycosyltransferase
MSAAQFQHLQRSSAVYSYSIVVPVYRNEENISDLLETLRQLAERLNERTEFIFVVDGSPDRSLLMLRSALPKQPFDAQVISHSRNFGSFAAIRTGLKHARGAYIGVMAADLQEPPELLVQMYAILRRGDADVVFGERVGRDDPILRRWPSDLFWRFYRTVVSRDMPVGGVDIFACTDRVRAALLSWEEARSSIIIQLFWIGFRRAFVPYRRRKRLHGRSAWSFSKRLDYLLDSTLAFTGLPIHVLFWVGTIGIAASVIAAVAVLGGWLLGRVSLSGYAAIVLLLAFLGSVQIWALGIIGLYVWHGSENVRRRPLALIASTELFDKSGPEP